MAKKKSDSADRHLPYKLVRMPVALYELLKKLADRNDRPVTRELRRAVEAHLRAHEEPQEE
jgi:predicted DNA-binding protein